MTTEAQMETHTRTDDAGLARHENPAPGGDPDPVTGPTEVVDELDRRDLTYEILGEHAVRVDIPSGDVVMGAVPFLDVAGSAVALLADGRDGSSAILMRDGQDMFVVRRDTAVWEHFRSMGGPTAVVGSWRAGQRTRFRQRHGALWMAIPEALTLAESLGVAHLMPAETPPPPPPPAPEKKAPSRRAAAPRKPKAPEKKAAEAPAPPPVCPRCFVQLPASGRCDCG